MMKRVLFETALIAGLCIVAAIGAMMFASVMEGLPA